MIDVASETIVPMNHVREHVPTRPHLATVWRWALRGVRGAKLETLRIGGRTVTSVEALGRFLKALNSDNLASPSAARERQIAAAEAELDALGV